MSDQEKVRTVNIYKQHIAASNQYVGGTTREEAGMSGNEIFFYKLSSNENALGPSPRAIEAIRAHLPLLHEYSYQHDGKFRNVLASHSGDGFTSAQFITANSGLELIELIARGFLDPGLECIISTPTFLAYKSLSEIQGAKVIDVPLTGPYFELDVQGILNAVNDRTRVLFLSNPNNPTGALIPGKVTDELINQLPDHVVVVYDEVYFHFADQADYRMARDYIHSGKQVIGLHSFSKAFGLAGIRLGYAFSTPDIAGYLNKIRRPFMINTLSMEAGIAALSDMAHLNNTRELIATEKKWLYEQLSAMGVSYLVTQANFILFRPALENHEFASKMLAKGIMVRTSEVFGLNGHIRVTIGVREANAAFIRAYKEIIADISLK